MIEALDGVSAAGLTVAGAAAVAGGLVRGFTGFGGALVMVPVLSLVLGPGAALAAVCASGVPVILQLLPAALRHAERAFVLPFAAAAFAAAPAGTWVLVAVSPAAMKIAISLAVLAMTALMAWGWRFPAHAGGALMAALGAGAGLIQGTRRRRAAGGRRRARPARVPGKRSARTTSSRGSAALGLCAAIPYWFHGLFHARGARRRRRHPAGRISPPPVGIRLFAAGARPGTALRRSLVLGGRRPCHACLLRCMTTARAAG